MSKVLLYTIMIVVGLLGGYGYWHFYGCVDGCAITGVWYRSSLYGGVMGFLFAGIIYDFIKPK